MHKKGPKTDIKNYRPISLTCLIIKIMERIVRDELMARCGHMIDPRQHGFLENKSCTTQLVHFCDSLVLSLNNNILSDVIYVDFAKAFNSVNHDLILKKLKSNFDIDGSLLDFLTNQAVVISGSTSSYLSVLFGVPQGSILDPTLFVLFLNVITSGLNNETKIMMHANDTKIWRQVSKHNDHLKLNGEVAQWLGHRIANRKISSSSPALPTVLRVRLERYLKPKQPYGSFSRMYMKQETEHEG